MDGNGHEQGKKQNSSKTNHTDSGKYEHKKGKLIIEVLKKDYGDPITHIVRNEDTHNSKNTTSNEEEDQDTRGGRKD